MGYNFLGEILGHIFIRLAVVPFQNREITRNSDKIWHYSRSRSSKVIDLGVKRKRICDFLLVINSSLGRICYRFRDIDAQSYKIFLDFPTPPLFDAPALEEPVRIAGCNLPCKNYRNRATVRWKFHNPNFNLFCMIHPYDGQTDRRSGGRAIA